MPDPPSPKGLRRASRPTIPEGIAGGMTAFWSLRRNRYTTAAQVAEDTGLSKQFVSYTLRQCARAGWVEAVKGKGCRLTSAGADEMEKATGKKPG